MNMPSASMSARTTLFLAIADAAMHTRDAKDLLLLARAYAIAFEAGDDLEKMLRT